MIINLIKKNRKDGEERRRYPRLDPEEEFLVEFRRKEAESLRLGQGKDISEGGLRFATSAQLHKGDELDVILYLPKKFPGLRKIHTRAKVRRVYHPAPTRRYRVACEFEAPQMSFHQTVTSYMDWSKSEHLPLR
jgi:hypothetical protein